jgi:hypothetical protein
VAPASRPAHVTVATADIPVPRERPLRSLRPWERVTTSAGTEPPGGVTLTIASTSTTLGIRAIALATMLR